jgi:hypothetical protein
MEEKKKRKYGTPWLGTRRKAGRPPLDAEELKRRAADARTPLERLTWAAGYTAYRLHKAMLAAGIDISMESVQRHSAGLQAISLLHGCAYAAILGCKPEDLLG